MDTLTLRISGMSCGHCVAAVKSASESVNGVSSVSVDLEQGSAFVSGSDLDQKALKTAIEEEGFEVTSIS